MGVIVYVEKRRNRFNAELEKQIGQLRRDTTSAHAKNLLTQLEQCRFGPSRMFLAGSGRSRRDEELSMSGAVPLRQQTPSPTFPLSHADESVGRSKLPPTPFTPISLR